MRRRVKPVSATSPGGLGDLRPFVSGELPPSHDRLHKRIRGEWHSTLIRQAVAVAPGDASHAQRHAGGLF